jgi:hypothetical protein
MIFSKIGLLLIGLFSSLLNNVESITTGKCVTNLPVLSDFSSNLVLVKYYKIFILVIKCNIKFKKVLWPVVYNRKI